MAAEEQKGAKVGKAREVVTYQDTHDAEAARRLAVQRHNALSGRQCDAVWWVEGDSASDKKAMSHIERRCPADGCRREVREQLLD